MTNNKAQKTAIRQRMADTGEPYSVARRAARAHADETALPQADETARADDPIADETPEERYIREAAEAGVPEAEQLGAMRAAMRAQRRAGELREAAERARERADRAEDAADLAEERAELAREAADLAREWADEDEQRQAQGRADRLRRAADDARERAGQAEEAAEEAEGRADAADDWADVERELAGERDGSPRPPRPPQRPRPPRIPRPPKLPAGLASLIRDFLVPPAS